jgi:hypothetical protein
MAMPSGSVRRWAAAALLLALAPPARAAEPAPAAPPSPIDAQSEQVLQRMSDLLGSAVNFTFHAEVAFDEVHGGQKLQFAAAMDAEVHHPDGLEVHYGSDFGAKQLWYDGKTVTVLDLAHGTWAREDAPNTIGAALDQLARDRHFSVPLGDLAYASPYAALTADVRNGFYVGLHDVDGVDCHHLAFQQDDLDWQIWIDAGKQPLPRKIVITYKKLPGAPQYAAVLSKWSFPAALPAGTFEAKLPKGAREIPFTKVPEDPGPADQP